MSKLFTDIYNEMELSEESQSSKRDAYDTFEQLFHNIVNDAVSVEGKSQIFDPKLSTMILERSYRVMSQMALGKAKAISKNDMGTATLMDLIVDKYVNPNANAQFDLLTK